MSLTDAQIEARRHWIGGSDAAALAGVNPPNWAQPIDVYLDKVGLSTPRPSNKMQALGSLMEDLVFTLAGEATGITWRRAGKPAHSRRFPWAGGNVDRYGTDPAGVPVVGEGKWSSRRDEWGDSWQLVDVPGGGQLYMPPTRQEVPLRYAIQVQHYLAVTERQAGVLVVLLGYADFRWYVLQRDEAMIGRLMEIEERFWVDHVLAGVPPQPDGSTGYGRHLRDRYAQDDATEAVATAHQQLLLRDLRATRQTLAAATQADAKAAQLVQDSMGTTARLVGPGWVVNWRRNRPTVKVQWEDWVTAILTNEHTGDDDWPTTKKGRAELVRQQAKALGFATEEPGARPFVVEFEEDQIDAA